jgi:phage tail sheath protein FI
MAAPGVTVTVRDAAPPRSAPTDTDTWFLTGFTEKGPTTPQLIQSLDDYVSTFGARVAYGYLYDCLDAYFHEGGSKAYVCRTLGPSPVLATHTFETAVPSDSIIVNAKSYGDWGNGLSIDITHSGSDFVIAVSLNSVLVETSPLLATQQDAVDWSDGSAYVDITLGAGTGIPAAATSALGGGTDDHGNATDDEWADAIELFTADLGPGQISMPGRTTAQSHADLLAHAQTNNRIAILDYADTGDASTLASAAATDRAAAGARYGAGFAPWLVIPGITASALRTIPYSAMAAALMARNDQAGISPNVPSAGGLRGVATYALGLSQAFSDADRGVLNDAGVDVATIRNGALMLFGYRTLVDPDADREHVPLSNARLEMAIVAQATAIGDRYVFAQIDGRGFTLADFAGDLAAMLQAWYDAGSLYGGTAGDAYRVNVGSPVNTAETAAALELNAQLVVRYSKFGEQVQIFITRTAITEAIS